MSDAKEPGQVDDGALEDRCASAVLRECHAITRAGAALIARAVLSAAGVERLREDFANACDVGRRLESRAEAAEKALAESRLECAQAQVDRKAIADSHHALALKFDALTQERDAEKARADEAEDTMGYMHTAGLRQEDRIAAIEKAIDGLYFWRDEHGVHVAEYSFDSLLETCRAALDATQPKQDSGQSASDRSDEQDGPASSAPADCSSLTSNKP